MLITANDYDREVIARLMFRFVEATGYNDLINKATSVARFSFSGA